MKRLTSLVLILSLFWAPIAWATSQQYVLPGTGVVFADSGQSGGNVVWTLSALASGAGRISAQYDKGAGAQPAFWQFVCRLQLTGTNVVGATVEYYIVRGDGTDTDGNVGTADAALTTDKRRNLQFIGTLVVDQTTTNTKMVATFNNVYIPSRYFSMGVWDATTLPFKTDTTTHRCAAYPMPFQMQNS